MANTRKSATCDPSILINTMKVSHHVFGVNFSHQCGPRLIQTTGDRKRWRDAVTERERKRYEGLFASNRGLHLPPTLPNNISNIVVRDLWQRSRLPRSELETIWNLVLASEPGKPSPPAQTSLNKEQFVVGLWLIDQRLKGRKLPIRVSETVWASVKGLQGIKIKKFLG